MEAIFNQTTRPQARNLAQTAAFAIKVDAIGNHPKNFKSIIPLVPMPYTLLIKTEDLCLPLQSPTRRCLKETSK